MTPRTEAHKAILARIQKLSRMTTSAGCSEAEASNAADHISRLLAEHNLTITEVELRSEAAACLTESFNELSETAQNWTSICTAIGSLFGTRAWITTVTEDALSLGIPLTVRKINYFGLPLDVAASLSLTAICYSAIITESLRYAADQKKAKKSAADDFRAGMANRLRLRINELNLAQQKAASVGGGANALVPLKHSLVSQEYAKLGLRLRASHASSPRNHQHYSAGSRAADRVDLNRKSSKLSVSAARISPNK